MTNEHSDQSALSSEAHRLPKGVHLVGSVPLSSAEEVFRTTSAILGERLRRIPDGETGVRHNWISWQREVFESHPLFEQAPLGSNAYGPRSAFKLRSQVSPGEIRFDRLGYADVAKASYVTFASLKQAGVISASVHFLVCLPTPLAPVTVFVAPSDRAIVEPGYEAAMLNELQQICAAIPHHQIAIQWDTAVEFGILEGVTPSSFTTPKMEIVGRLLRLGASVPADVELGYHLCYGDAGHKHFKEPEDTSKLVEIANALAAGLTRPLNWIHLPVPRNRSDDAYVAPLKQLQLHPETELYLGLVHFTDGVEGTLKRIQAAKQFVTDFGVATECGFGRRPTDTIPALLRIQSQVTEPV